MILPVLGGISGSNKTMCNKRFSMWECQPVGGAFPAAIYQR